MAGKYYRVYMYTDSSNKYYHDTEMFYDFAKFTIVDGDTTHKITEITRLAVGTDVHLGSSLTQQRPCRFDVQLFSGTQDNYISHPSSSPASVTTRTIKPGEWVEASVEWDLTRDPIPASDFNSLSAVYCCANYNPIPSSSSTGYNLTTHPLILVVEFDSEEYNPSISDFFVERCDNEGRSSATGEYVKYGFKLNTAMITQSAEGETFSVKLNDGLGSTLGHDVYTKSGINDVNAIIGESIVGNTYTSPTIIEYDAGVRTIFTLEFIYHGERVADTRIIFPAEAFISKNKSNYGFAIGKFAAGDSANNALFEVGERFKSVFYGGIKGVNIDNANGIEEKTGGSFSVNIEGVNFSQPVYRRIFAFAKVAGIYEDTTDISDVGFVTSIKGVFTLNTTNDVYPIGFMDDNAGIYSGCSLVKKSVQASGTTYHLKYWCSQDALFFITIEYTKV